VGPFTDGLQNELAQFESAVDAVIAALNSDETVLVHCSHGASRVPSVAAPPSRLLGTSVSKKRLIGWRPTATSVTHMLR
jgi:predicted protein tyrosine phosphatase